MTEKQRRSSDNRDRKPGFGGRQGDAGHEGKHPETEPNLNEDRSHLGIDRRHKPPVTPRRKRAT